MKQLLWTVCTPLLLCAADQQVSTLIAAGKSCLQKADQLRPFIVDKSKQKGIEKRTPSPLRLHVNTCLQQHQKKQGPLSVSSDIVHSLYFNALAFFRHAYQKADGAPMPTLSTCQQAQQTLAHLTELNVDMLNKHMFIITPWRELLMFWQTKKEMPNTRDILRASYDTHLLCKEALTGEQQLTEHGRTTYITECIDSMHALCYLHQTTDEPLNKQRIRLYIGALYRLVQKQQKAPSNDPTFETAAHLQRKPFMVANFICNAEQLLATGKKQFKTATVQHSAPLKAEYIQLFSDILCDLEHLHTHAYNDILDRINIQHCAQQLIACIEEHNIVDDHHDEWQMITHAWQERLSCPITLLDTLQKTIAPFFSQPLPRKKKEKKQIKEQRAEIGAQYLVPLWHIFAQADEPTPQTQAASSSDHTINLKYPEQRYIQLKAALCAEQIKAAIWPNRDEKLYNLSAHLHAAYRPWVRHRHDTYMNETKMMITDLLETDYTDVQKEKHDLLWTGKLLLLLQETTKKKDKHYTPLFERYVQRLYTRYQKQQDFTEQELDLLLTYIRDAGDVAMQAAVIKMESRRDQQQQLDATWQQITGLIEKLDRYKTQDQIAPTELFVKAAQLLLDLTKYEPYRSQLQTTQASETPRAVQHLKRVTAQLYSIYAENPLGHPELPDLLRALSIPSGMHHITACIEQIDNSPLGPASLARLFKRLKETEERLTNELAQKKAR